MSTDPLVIAVVVTAIAGLVKVAEQVVLKQNQRLRRIEQKLDLLLNHLTIDNPEDTAFINESVRALLKAGLVSSAIKTYSENTGASPEESEEIILAIDRQMKRRNT